MKSYLLHRIIGQLSVDIKMENYKIKTSCVSPNSLNALTNKIGFNLKS